MYRKVREQEQTISIFVNNQPGVLSRVGGVFGRHGYNIKSLCVAETTNPEISRITLTSESDPDFTEKIKKQLDKLVDVKEVYRSFRSGLHSERNDAHRRNYKRRCTFRDPAGY